MSKRWLYVAFGAVAAIGIGAVSTLVAQSVYPVRFDDSEAAVSVARAPGSGVSALTVEGQVLTLDSAGYPRLWGRGRPSVKVYLEEGQSKLCSKPFTDYSFGLSNVLVDWGSAADGCPADFWVCTLYEVQGNYCDTQRPESVADGRSCSGAALLWDSDAHQGWTASASSAQSLGVAMKELAVGAGVIEETCNNLPVWCCTE